MRPGFSPALGIATLGVFAIRPILPTEINNFDHRQAINYEF
jgi:hypothetical protein